MRPGDGVGRRMTGIDRATLPARLRATGRHCNVPQEDLPLVRVASSVMVFRAVTAAGYAVLSRPLEFGMDRHVHYVPLDALKPFRRGGTKPCE